MSNYQNRELKVDIVLFSIIDNQLKVFLTKRNIEPFKNQWSLTGGYIPPKMNAYQAALFQLEKKTGLSFSNLRLVDIFSDPNRDPSGNIASCAFMSLVNSKDANVIKTKFSSDYKWTDLKNLNGLAFDHKKIIQSAQKILIKDIKTTKMGFELASNEFTIKELIQIFETVTNKKLDQSNIRRKMNKLNLLINTNKLKKETVGRPSPIFKLNLKSYKELDEFETLFN